MTDTTPINAEQQDSKEHANNEDHVNGDHDSDQDDQDTQEHDPNQEVQAHQGEQPTEVPTNINLQQSHPLENEWSFWYDKRPAAAKRVRGEQESYESNLREIGCFGTVEDFWRYYNHMMKPSKIENNSNYHFFKKGVKPMWEDSSNVKGGKWVLTLKGDKSLADSIWENVVLALVGETIDVEDEICGAVFSKRKGGDRIAIWNRRRENDAGIVAIGRHLKSIVGPDIGKVHSSYQNHEDSIKSGASYTNPSKYKL